MATHTRAQGEIVIKCGQGLSAKKTNIAACVAEMVCYLSECSKKRSELLEAGRACSNFVSSAYGHKKYTDELAGVYASITPR